MRAGRLACPAGAEPTGGGTAVLARPAATRAAPTVRVALAVVVIGLAVVVLCVTVPAYAHRLVETTGALGIVGGILS